MPQPQAGQAGQPETDHGEATQLGALTYSAPMSMYKAIASVKVFPTLTLARNCKLATKLWTFKSMWEMWRVPQPNVERRRSFNIDQNGGEKLWVKNSRR